jgi:hypothetical protein
MKSAAARRTRARGQGTSSRETLALQVGAALNNRRLEGPGQGTHLVEEEDEAAAGEEVVAEVEVRRTVLAEVEEVEVETHLLTDALR